MGDQEKSYKLRVGFSEDEKTIEVSLPPEEPRPWDLNDELEVMGREHQRLDGPMKVTGRARFTHDINLPGLLFGGFVRSPHAAARVREIDLSAAEKHPQVKAILNLGRRRIRYAGEPLVALAAETRQGLDEAKALVRISYEVLPHAARIEQAMAADAPQVFDNRPNVTEPRRRRRAQRVEAELERAERVVEAEVHTQVQTHSSLETHGVVAQWNGDDLVVWASTQSTFGVRRQIASFLQRRGIDVRNLEVRSEFIGGGFGSKFSAGYFGIAAVRLAKMADRPVKIMLDRREEHTDVGNRPSSIQKMKLEVGDKGELGAYQVIATGTPGVGRGASATNPMIYDFDNSRVDRRQGEIATNAGPQAAFRAPGHPQGSFGLETILDLAAEEIGMDPLAFRMRNDSHPVRRAQYADGARRIGWKQRRPNGSQKGRYRTGYGVAASRWRVLGGPRAEILCKIRPDGTVEARSGAQDIGTGTRTLIAIVVAEELGIPLDRVSCAIGNTNDPIGPGSGGSTTAPSIAPAARQAAYLAGKELKQLAARHLECEAKEVVLDGGELRGKGKKISFADACRLIGEGEITALGRRRPNFATYHPGVGGVQFAQVTVDCDFGLVKVDKVVALQDCGRIVNKLATESQVNGGVIQGLSWALFEDRHMDRHLGHMINSDMETYKILGPVDMPEIETVLYDVANGGNTTGVLGVGEPPMIPTAAAVAGAVHNACGIRLTRLPMTPDQVLAALEAKERG